MDLKKLQLQKQSMDPLIVEINSLFYGEKQNLLNVVCNATRELGKAHLLMVQKMEFSKERMEEKRAILESFDDVPAAVERLRAEKYENIQPLGKAIQKVVHTDSRVLAFADAKEKTEKLNDCIHARRSLDQFLEESVTGSWSCLTDLHHSVALLKEIVPSANLFCAQMEFQKDFLFASLSSCLVDSFNRRNRENLAEIYKIYEIFERKEEFLLVFSQTISHTLSIVSIGNSGFASILRPLMEEISNIFENYNTEEIDFLGNDLHYSFLTSSMKKGIDQIDFHNVVDHVVSAIDDPIECLNSLKEATWMPTSQSEHKTSIVEYLREQILKCAMEPIKSEMRRHSIEEIDKMELESGSFRDRVESLGRSVSALTVFLQEILTVSLDLYDKNCIFIVEPVDSSISHIVSKLDKFLYRMDSSGRKRNLQSLIMICSASGLMLREMNNLRNVIVEIDDSLSFDIYPLYKWNAQVVQESLEEAASHISDKMQNGIAAMAESCPSTSTSLPSFATTPSEYVTTTAQDILTLLHTLEVHLREENVKNSFDCWAQNHLQDGSSVLPFSVLLVAMSVISRVIALDFIRSIGNLHKMSKSFRDQVLVDAGFLLDALDDLHIQKPKELEKIIKSLKN